jgi:DUF4097 and DUF4098 domain-containing protein YvlB
MIKALMIVAMLSSVAHADDGVLQADAQGFVHERGSVKFAPAKGVVIKSVHVDNRLGDIEVVGSDDSSVTLSYVKTALNGDTLSRLKIDVPVPDQSGVIDISTVLLPGKEEQIVASGSIRVDVTITVPRKVALDLKAWNGKVAASGMRNGAKLMAHDAQIAVTDVAGGVTTASTRGEQKLTDVKGTVQAQNDFGNTSLDQISGDLLAARSDDGSISATHIRSRTVKLETTSGEITYSSELLAGGKYDFASYKGDIKLKIGPDVALKLSAYARQGEVTSHLELSDEDRPEKGRLMGTFAGSGNQKPATLDVKTIGGMISLGLMNE